ncbi:MAG: SDR family oxidoreductase [Opitutaceae bacterium]|nr:SDR family oxidoreductase [Opitutaceae bacterium]
MNTNPSVSSGQKIVVVGGSGLIGRPLVGHLRRLGHEVVVAAPSSGINTVTGAGLAAALAGADVIVDVSNSPSFEPGPVLEFFARSTRNLLAAGRAAGVRHFVALSVVGTDRLPDSGYFRAKLAQERLIQASGIPYTIVRATQFFEFAPAILQGCTQGELVRVPPVRMQPIAAADVSAALAELALRAPAGAVLELAGPEAFSQEAFLRPLLSPADGRRLVVDPSATYFGAQVDDHSLTPGAHPRLGATRYADWLAKGRPIASAAVAT